MRSDKIYKVKISIAGFTRAQVEEGLPDLLNEFKRRPWLFDAQAFWDDSENKLVTIIGYELNVRLEEGAIDEVSDCVLATMQFDKKIDFDIQRI